MPTTPILGLTYPTPFDPATADLWGGILNTLFLGLDAEHGTKTVNLSFADFTLSRAVLEDTGETAFALGNISGAVAIDYEDGHLQYGTLTGNISGITVSNWPASGTGAWLTLELIQDGTGGHTLALSSAYKTAGGTAITLTTTASARDKLRLESRDAGSTIDTFINLDMQ